MTTRPMPEYIGYLQLKQLARMTPPLPGRDNDDVQLWLALVGDKFDMRNLSEKTLENLDALFRRHFES